MSTTQCKQCGKEFSVVPARLKTAKFCSLKCRGDYRKLHFTGANNPNWRGGSIVKNCHQCGVRFEAVHAQSNRKFCSKSCADKGGFRYSGEDHPNYREDARHRNRCGGHHKWVNAVISRDKATCQECGAAGKELHAHHIRPYKDHPDLRFDVSNGVTLCYSCHWAVHTALNAKAVNSGNILPGKAEDNPEPSLKGNLLEGVTTRGRAYRRWVGPCSWCGSIISKRFSDTKGKSALFCNKHCMGKYAAANRTYRRWANPDKPMAVTSSTSAARESDDIV